MKTVSIEDVEAMAQRLLRLARDIGAIAADLQAMARLGCPAITNEAAVFEVIWAAGETVTRAANVLAMRLDRAALVKFTDAKEALRRCAEALKEISRYPAGCPKTVWDEAIAALAALAEAEKGGGT